MKTNQLNINFLPYLFILCLRLRCVSIAHNNRPAWWYPLWGERERERMLFFAQPRNWMWRSSGSRMWLGSWQWIFCSFQHYDGSREDAITHLDVTGMFESRFQLKLLFSEGALRFSLGDWQWEPVVSYKDGKRSSISLCFRFPGKF